MAATTLFNSPMTRKKPVERKYQPNSYRVISEEAELWQRPQRSSTFTCVSDMNNNNNNIIGQPVKEKYGSLNMEHRKNRPNPNHCGFLRQNVSLLCEPVCDVYTDNSHHEQWSWWPSRTSNTPVKKSEHTLDTTVREDFQYRGADVPGNTRHISNPNVTAAHGIAPVNKIYEKDGKQRFWKEGISYEQEFNSRVDPQYARRGRRQGAFVWERMPQNEVDRLLEEFGETPQTSGMFIDTEERRKGRMHVARIKPVSKSAKSVEKSSPPIHSPPTAKSAHSHVASPKAASPAAKVSNRSSAITTPPVVKAKEATVEVMESKPLSRSRTESILSMASQQLQKMADKNNESSGAKTPPLNAL